MLKTHPNVTLYSTKNCQSRKQVLWKSFSFCAKNKKGRKTLGVNTCASHLWIFITLLNKNISKYDTVYLSINLKSWQSTRRKCSYHYVTIAMKWEWLIIAVEIMSWHLQKINWIFFFFPKQSGYWIRRGLIFLLGVNRIFHYLFLSLQNSDNIITPTKSISSFLLSSIKDFPLSLSLAIIFLSFVF